MRDYSISIYHDTRRKKADGTFPVKLRIYHPFTRKTKYFPTIFDLSIHEFQRTWETVKPRKEYKPLRKKLQALEIKAERIAEKISPFTFEQFEKKMFRKMGEGNNVFQQYGEAIQKLRENNQLGTANNYEFSLKSIKAYLENEKGSTPIKLSFYEITPDWLNRYEKYMLVKKGRTRTTISMYLRALRTIFNNAIEEGEAERETYPFGKRKYLIPASKGVKKALTREELGRLFKSNPRTPEQEKAKDFWFFSYSCNGINIKDIALLKYENLHQDKIIFYRAKTINTSKTELKPVVAYLSDFARETIEKYGNPEKHSKQFIFPIIEEGQDEITRQNKIKNFTRFVNQALKKLAKAEGLPKEISTYWARHSFATNAIRSGASMEFVSEALNHSNMKTTQTYFSGFEEEKKKELVKNLMEF